MHPSLRSNVASKMNENLPGKCTKLYGCNVPNRKAPIYEPVRRQCTQLYGCIWGRGVVARWKSTLEKVETPNLPRAVALLLRLLSKNLKFKIYRIVILPVVLYGCEIWSLTLREERKLRVFENMVLRRIFVPRREEVTGEWRRLHNEDLNHLYSSPNIVRVIKSRRMKWAGHVALMCEVRRLYSFLVGKTEGRIPLGRPSRRLVDNIRMDLQEVRCVYMDWIGLAQDRDSWRKLVSAVMNLRVPWNVGSFLTSRRAVSFSRRTLHHWIKISRNFWFSNLLVSFN